jgi:hypothetical protein
VQRAKWPCTGDGCAWPFAGVGAGSQVFNASLADIAASSARRIQHELCPAPTFLALWYSQQQLQEQESALSS